MKWSARFEKRDVAVFGTLALAIIMLTFSCDQKRFLNAALDGDDEKIQELLQNGADINHKSSSSKETALISAVIRDDISAVDVLLKNGADQSVTNGMGRTALYVAAEKGLDEIIELLYQFDNVSDTQDINGETALLAAVSNHHPKSVEIILRNGANTTLTGIFDETAFYNAVRHGDWEVVNAFLIESITVSEQDVERILKLWGLTDRETYFIFERKTYKEISEFLFSENADINAKDSHGRTLLMKAADGWYTGKTSSFRTTNGFVKMDSDSWQPSPHTSLVSYLISRGAEINARDNGGRTALMWASDELLENPTIVRMLVENGADVNARDNEGWTALMYASRYGKRGMATIYYSLPTTNAGVARVLLANGAKVNIVNNEGRTALMYAVEEVHLDIVEALLEYNADPSIEDANGQTALNYSRMERNRRTTPTIESVLLNAGAK